ncbi:MAG: 6-phosphofructokinase, partial [Acidobacteria bacterium]|nr:6-phosphofructokinase [Acidobacteriota bacterium]
RLCAASNARSPPTSGVACSPTNNTVRPSARPSTTLLDKHRGTPGFIETRGDSSTLDEVGATVASAFDRGRHHEFVVVAEGAELSIHAIARHLDDRGIGFESRIATLGYVQRGGSPSAFDRMLASRMGVAAVKAIGEDESDVFTALKGQSIELASLVPTTTAPRTAEIRRVTEIFSR